MKKHIAIYFELIKYRVSLTVAFTTLAGYIFYARQLDAYLLCLALGIFLLAGGSSALNQWQESDFDALMARTCNRPIPSKRLRPARALVLAVSSVLLGTFILYFCFGILTALLGLLNLFWYNVLYTKLKRVTAFAVVPGSFVGAIPVLIGWVAAGGYVFDISILYIAFFLFVWQIPHFWLLMFKYGEDYQKAGFVVLTQVLDFNSLKRVIFSWLIATAFTSMLVPLFMVDSSLALLIWLSLLNLVFVFYFIRNLFWKNSFEFMKSFLAINIYMIAFILILISFHLS